MLIALVYDLRDEYRALGFSEEEVAEFDSVETIGALEASLRRLGYGVERVGNGRRLAERLAAGARWDLVLSIAEGLAGRSREAQVPALLELFGQPYVFSDPLTLAVSLDKAVAKRLVRDAGVPTVPFAVLETAHQAAEVVLPFPVFVKPLAEGTSKGCDGASRVLSKTGLEEVARRLIQRFRQPVIVEPYLPGREFTVGVLGNGIEADVVGVLEVRLNAGAEEGVYSQRNKEECESLVTYALAADPEAMLAASRALDVYRVLGCRDAARIDFRSDSQGSPHFIEANPLAGLHPTHSDLPIVAGLAGVGYDALIATIIDAAVRRCGLVPSEPLRRKA